VALEGYGIRVIEQIPIEIPDPVANARSS